MQPYKQACCFHSLTHQEKTANNIELRISVFHSLSLSCLARTQLTQNLVFRNRIISRSFHRFLVYLFSLLILFTSVIPTLSSAKPSDTAADLYVIISDRSAPTFVEGAHLFLAKHSTQHIQVRTISQTALMPEKEFRSEVLAAKRVLMIGIYGEPVERLLAIPYPNEQSRTILRGDRRLLRLQHDRQGEPFRGKDIDRILAEISPEGADETTNKATLHPQFSDWLTAQHYWVNQSAGNVATLIEFLISGNAVRKAEIIAPVRFFAHTESSSQPQSPTALTKHIERIKKPVLWVFDHDTGDRGGNWNLHREICDEFDGHCISVLANWGAPSVEAMQVIQNNTQRFPAYGSAIISLQDFVVGGGQGRENVTNLLQNINIPVFKAIRVTEHTTTQWQISANGLPRDSVHYRIAMPELQGIGQPHIVAMASAIKTDALTGANVSTSVPLQTEVSRLLGRAERWIALQQKNNAEKRIAIVYYNHPPGRHNIGADNLNVPESLFDILHTLKRAGYTTGDLPSSSETLLDLIQTQGINLPEDKEALKNLYPRVVKVTTADYKSWLKTLPESTQQELRNGPLAQLHVMLKNQLAQVKQIEQLMERNQMYEQLDELMQSTMTNLHHAIDGVRHPSRMRALNLLEQVKQRYHQHITTHAMNTQADWEKTTELKDALIALQIEGIRGWGKAPGNIMVWNGRLLVPGLQFGNIFIGPQPPRGWELNEELLHANLSFPPPHQYLAFYYHLHHQFQADAIIHLGRHSTYEFLPRRGVGVGGSDYSSIVIGDTPSIYPYIVDGVGEGIQAKRRGSAVMIDHLTPPLATTQLYDDLLTLRQLIESAEAATDDNTKSRAVVTLKATIDKLHLREALIESMDEELKVRGIGFEEIDDDFLLHEVGHYLTHIQEDFMPLGLHVFGRPWSAEAETTMLNSMADGRAIDPAWASALHASPKEEMRLLLEGLNGKFIPPGKGNDPIRTPDSLPTGRNFYALDGSLLPTKIGYDIGKQLAELALKNQMQGQEPVEFTLPNAVQTDSEKNKTAIILWASDTVRDEGAMIAFGLHLLGVQPVWNSRGIIKGLERLPSNSIARRQDVVFTTSGLFRDLYGTHLELLDKAVLMALDASRDTILNDYPALTLALRGALEPLGKLQVGGNEPLSTNQVANNWLNEARTLLREHPELDPTTLGRTASLRIFGTAPGAYGAGINRLVERSGSWDDRKQLGKAYINRMGHAYGINLQGQPAHQALRQQLIHIDTTYLGRASNLYGLLDNNDAFDYLGGLNLAIETLTESAPRSAVIHHANTAQLRIDALPTALLSELRGRFLNPQWIKPLMQEGYAGARTMGSEFIEYLWGWQVTSPEIIDDWVWEDVKQVYIDDKHNLGLKEFLEDGHNVHVQTNILAVMLVAIDKDFWDADNATVKQLANAFASNIIEHGIPGSGHTHANHPMYTFVKRNISSEMAENLEKALAKSRVNTTATSTPRTKHIQELTLALETQKSDEANEHSESPNENGANMPVTIPPTTQSPMQETSKEGKNQQAKEENSMSDETVDGQHYSFGIAAIMFILLVAGFIRGRK